MRMAFTDPILIAVPPRRVHPELLVRLDAGDVEVEVAHSNRRVLIEELPETPAVPASIPATL